VVGQIRSGSPAALAGLKAGDQILSVGDRKVADTEELQIALIRQFTDEGVIPLSVRRDGAPVDLTSVEFNLLEVLLREAGRVVPRERLVNAVLSRKFSPFDRSIDMHVSKVRKKLGDTDSDEHIKTIRGVGYIFARPREKVKTTP